MMFLKSPIIILLFVPFFVQAQHFEIGILAGGSNYEGDLAPSASVISFSETHPAFSLFARYAPAKWFALRLSYTHATISGNDANANDFFRRRRNLHFKSQINEVAFNLELRPAGNITLGAGSSLTPYVYTGIAGYQFNPQAEYQGQWLDLQPLTTEGQGTSVFPDKSPYQLTQIAIPMGAGIKVNFLYLFSIGVDVGFRKTFTDYLDDVSTVYVDQNILRRERGEPSAQLANRSAEYLNEPINWSTGTQRGDPQDKDWYIVGGITFGVKIFNPNGNHAFRKRRGVKCPSF